MTDIVAWPAVAGVAIDPGRILAVNLDARWQGDAATVPEPSLAFDSS